MDVTPRIAAGRQVIEGYGSGRFQISGRVIDGAIVVFPNIVSTWAVDPANPDFASLEPIMRAAEGPERVELLLIGCGARMLMVPAEPRALLRRAGIVVEPMDTGAACRTYNVLLTEGRRVAAALLPIE